MFVCVIRSDVIVVNKCFVIETLTLATCMFCQSTWSIFPVDTGYLSPALRSSDGSGCQQADWWLHRPEPH